MNEDINQAAEATDKRQALDQGGFKVMSNVVHKEVHPTYCYMVFQWEREFF